MKSRGRLKKIDQLELWERLKEHELWLADQSDEEDPETGHVVHPVRAVFENLDMSDLDFANRTCGDIIQRDLMLSKFIGCRLWNCNFEGVDFTQAVIERCDFRRANLRDTTFYMTKLFGNNFSKAMVYNAEINVRQITLCTLDQADGISTVWCGGLKNYK